MPPQRDETGSAPSGPWQRLSAPASWRDLSLPLPSLSVLRRIAAEVVAQRRGHAVETATARPVRAPGMAVLFAGPPGSGRTLAAQVLAAELGLDLYRVDLAAALSRWIGETEKNLRELFDAVEAGSAVLFFDEADALFGKRSEVEDAHDRYANLEVSDLLERIEEFGGLAILAVNIGPDIDPAALRRLRYAVEFSPPARTQVPGVYVEEVPAGARTIAGVETSIAAFVGRTPSGPTDGPLLVASFGDFEHAYGGLAVDCPLSYAVRHFFDNGGSRAVIARVVHRDASGNEEPAAPISDADMADPSLAPLRRGLWLLDQADLFSILCIPPLARGADVGPATWEAAIGYAKSRRAMVIVDPPAAWTTPAAAKTGLGNLVSRDANAALYFPRILAADPLTGSASEAFAPCGAIAGIYARTDAQRGVWRSPAGADAALAGTSGLTASLSTADVEALNPLAINCLRTFPAGGPVVWGARTLAGVDGLASEWKYVGVRRLALFIEESLVRGTRWAVFEPNDEPLWARLRSSAGAFLRELFVRGALQGRTVEEAFFVGCGRDTTTQSDLDRGIVDILVGFAPLKPAEFVILRLSVLAAALG